MNLECGFVRKEWLLSNPEKDYSTLVKFIEDNDDALTTDRYVPVFRKRTAMTSIFLSNTLEGTLPQGSTASDTYNILEKMYESSSIPVEQWDVGGDKPSRTQMSHHLRALQFLTKPEILKRDITVVDILEVHRIMMENSIGLRDNGFRTHSVYAEHHVYPEGDKKNWRKGVCRFCQSIMRLSERSVV
jgi:hypothetical protein